MPSLQFQPHFASFLSKKGFATRASLIIAIAIVLVASVVTLWATARMSWRSSVINTMPVHVSTASPHRVVQQNQGVANPPPSSITLEAVTLTYDGFQPKEFEREAGTFVLGVNNQTRIADLSFELLRENGHKVHEVKMTNGQLRSRKLLHLPAGSYTLRVVDHPEWTCSIVLSR
jgi:hypothetical protein